MTIHNAYMTIGKRIEAARNAKGWPQWKLGEAIGKDQTTISSWERGRTEPTRDDVVRVAIALQMPLEEIETLGSSRTDLFAPRHIPFLSWVSAGQISDVGDLEQASEADTVTVADLPPGDFFVTEVRGDSMDRVSPDGSKIIVNVSNRQLLAGKAYVFSLRGETTYKYFQPDPVPRLEPYSTNPMHRTIFLDQSESWTVVGRVWRSYIDLG
jgi:SOS-response transcriptional repressor LexA